MQNLSTIDDGILFKFLEDISGGQFNNRTEWGLIIKDKVDDVKRPRWAKVLVTGPKVKNVSIGQYILIENLRWTNALEYNGEKFWKTNEREVIMTSDEEPKGFN